MPEPPTPAATVEFRHVTKRYAAGARDVPGAVNDLSFEVPAGKICVLVGPSGCGKTTSLKMVNRLIEPTSGQILIDGDDAARRDPTELRRGIGYVIQQVGLFPHQTIADNVATVPRLLGWSTARRRERADELLALVGLDPATYGPRYPGQLSGGERQRVGVARALAADPPIMLMDEPFGAVDPIVRERLQNEFLRLQAELAKTILFVTHDIDEAIKMGDLVAVMQEGGRARPVRAAGRDPGRSGLGLRGPLRRRGPGPEAALARDGSTTWTLRPAVTARSGEPAGPVAGPARRGRRSPPARRRRRRPPDRLGRATDDLPPDGPVGLGARGRRVAAARSPDHPEGRPLDAPRGGRPGGDRRRSDGAGSKAS